MNAAGWIAVVALGLVFFAGSAYMVSSVRVDSEAPAGQEDAGVSGLEEELARLNENLSAMNDRIDGLRAHTARLSDRVDTLETRAETAGTMGSTGAAQPAAFSPGEAGDAARARSEEAIAAENDEFLTLLERLWEGDGPEELSTDEQEQFWKMARSGVMDRVIDDMEADVEANPGDLDARMELANVYVAKLLSVPGGPERGVWSSKAENQWKAVVERDQNHWEAHSALGMNYSYYPEFLNRTDDAIEWLEKGRKIIETQPVNDDHVENFVRLSQMYQRQGKNEKALEVLNQGLGRHPNEKSMVDAVDRLETMMGNTKEEGR